MKATCTLALLGGLVVNHVLASPLPPLVWTEAPGGVFVEGEACRFEAAGATAEAPCAVVGFLGERVAEGAFRSGSFETPPLGCGYYELKAEGARPFAFAVVPPPETRTPSPGRFFAADSGFAVVAAPSNRLKGQRWFGGDAYRLVARLMRLAGVEATRDRLHWTRTEPERGAFEWGRYAVAAGVLREYGIPDSGCYHDAPAWTGRKASLPTDLAAVHAFSRRAAADFGEAMDSWEFWNEPDHAAPEPVWEVAAALKAAALGFRDGRPEAVVAGPALVTATSVYGRALYESEIAKYVDVHNFHCYEELVKHPALPEVWRRFQAECGLDGMAMRITECNEPFTARKPEEPDEGDPEGRTRVFSREQERVQAEILPKVMLSHRFCGVERAYWFIVPPFNPPGTDWGMMRRDGTVRPAYAAFSTMTAVLSQQEMVGEADLGRGFKGYVFRAGDGRQTLAFWSEAESDAGRVTPENCDLLDRTLRLPAPDGDYPVVSLCGAKTTAHTVGGILALEATRYPAYVGGLDDVPVKRPASTPGTPRRYASAPDEDLSVVVRAELDPRDYRLAENKTTAEMDGDTLRVRLHVWNLSDVPKRCRLSLEGGAMKGAEGPILVPPMAERTVDAEVAPAPDGDYRTTLRFGGTAEGRRISALSVRVRMVGAMTASARRIAQDWRDLSRWSRNDNADEGRISWDEAEQAVRVDLRWRESRNDMRWCFPSFRLDREVLDDSLMVEFEARNEQDGREENDWRFGQARFTGTFGNGDKFRSAVLNPIISQWEVRRVDSTEAARLAAAAGGGNDASDVRFGAGGSPRAHAVTLWFRNVVVLGRTPSGNRSQ